MDIHEAFRVGAKKLAADAGKYSLLHKDHGIEEGHWMLLTQEEYWTPDQVRQIRSILSNVIEVSMTIGGLPSIPLPGQYAAAVIAEVVSPMNRYLACLKVPETFDAIDASGILGTSQVKPMTFQQMMGLVTAYSGGIQTEPAGHRLPKKVNEVVDKVNQKK